MPLRFRFFLFPLFRFLHWFDRNNWTPEMYELTRPDRPHPELTGSTYFEYFDIYAATPYRNISAGDSLGTVPASSIEEALAVWAGNTPYERVAENRVRFRHQDEVVAVPEGERFVL